MKEEQKEVKEELHDKLYFSALPDELLLYEEEADMTGADPQTVCLSWNVSRMTAELLLCFQATAAVWTTTPRMQQQQP